MTILQREPKNNIADSESFRFKSKFLDNTNNAGIIDAKVGVPLKYLSYFWRTLVVPLVICEISLILTWQQVVEFLNVIE